MASLLIVALGGCATGRAVGGDDEGLGPDGTTDAGWQGVADADVDAAAQPDAAVWETGVEASPTQDSSLDPDAACATAVESAQVEKLPVDIIWVVDNSVSMQDEIAQVTAGLNAFAAMIGEMDLDYKVIMLSLRSATNPVTINRNKRFGVCIPQPLAGDNKCGNGPRFFHSSIDIRSTQPLEQFLGTLGQTKGYREGEERGGEPWRDQLRADATRTIVVVTDDNSRLSAYHFDWFGGGANPNNSNYQLPPGLMHSSWNGLFDGYIFSGIYGWGSETDPNISCDPSDTTLSPGVTYSELVLRTKGVRAQICDGADAWQPFFTSVAQAVSKASKIRCDLEIPEPPSGTLNPHKVNVLLAGETETVVLHKVAQPADCDEAGGWYYDDEAAPTRVHLCPASCDQAQKMVQEQGGGSIQVQFGCDTIIK